MDFTQLLQYLMPNIMGQQPTLTGVPSLSDLMQTPPTFPGQQMPVTADVSDLVNQIQQIMGAPLPAMPMPQQPQGLKGFGQGLLQGLPQALGVFLSATDAGQGAGGALLNQLNQARAIQLRREEQDYQRVLQQELQAREMKVNLLRDEINSRREIAGEQRKVKLFEAQKQIEKNVALDLKASDFQYKERELEMIERLDAKYSGDRLKRLEEEVFIRNLPQRELQTNNLAADYMVSDPTLDPEVALRLAGKMTGLIKSQLSPGEKQLLNNVNKIRATRMLRREEAEVGKLEAERKATETGTRYMGRSGDLDTREEWLRTQLNMKALRESIDSDYVKDVQTGQVMNRKSLSPVQQLRVGEGKQYIQLSKEETDAENLRRLEEAKQAEKSLKQQSQNRIETIEREERGVVTTGGDPVKEKIVEIVNAQQLNKEQIMQYLMQISGISPDLRREYLEFLDQLLPEGKKASSSMDKPAKAGYYDPTSGKWIAPTTVKPTPAPTSGAPGSSEQIKGATSDRRNPYGLRPN